MKMEKNCIVGVCLDHGIEEG